MCAASDQPAIDVDATTTESGSEEGAVTSKATGIRAWFSKWMKFDREQLGKLGVDAFFTYGVVSNINAGITVALAWGTFSRTTGLSPLAPGMWPKFGATYFAIYLSLGSLLRPVRLAASVGLTPVYSKTVARIQDALPFRTTRPKLNRTLALLVMSLGFNTVGTCSLIALGVYVAGVVTGVPAVPPGWRPPFLAA